jgi:large subunit ribosomal protein L10
LVFGQEDVSQTIKSFIEFQGKVKPKLVIKGGAILGDPNPLDSKSIEAIGSLPPKEILLAQIAGYLVSTPTQVVQTINQLIGGIGELAVKVAEKQDK